MHLLQLHGQLLLGIFHRICHMELFYGIFVTFSAGVFSCCKASCSPAATLRTMFAWCMPVSSAVRLDVSHSSRCAEIKLTHVLWIVVVKFHLLIANPKLPVL